MTRWDTVAVDGIAAINNSTAVTPAMAVWKEFTTRSLKSSAKTTRNPSKEKGNSPSPRLNHQPNLSYNSNPFPTLERLRSDEIRSDDTEHSPGTPFARW